MVGARWTVALLALAGCDQGGGRRPDEDGATIELVNFKIELASIVVYQSVAP